MDKPVNTIFVEDHADKQSYEEEDIMERNLDAEFMEDDDDESDPQNIDSEDLENVLDGEEETKGEMLLRFKVNELQKICNSLSATNQRLIKKVEIMEQEKQKQNSSDVFVDEYSELNTEFTQVENLICEYRSSLGEFQKNVLTDLKSKDEMIENLRNEVKSLNRAKGEFEREKLDIEKLNRQLETKNESLLIEIENLEKNRNILEEKLNARGSQKYQQRSHALSFEDEISNEVQLEYEQLIDKLVKELEYEKKIRKKLNEEIKRMSNQLLESEREIMDKNRKLYEIQMKLLKASKSTSDSSSNQVKLHQEKSEKNGKNANAKTDTRSNFVSFPLLQLINGEIEEPVSAKERKIIGHKIIEFYQRKLSKEDYSNVMPENLLVANFNRKRPQMVLIRKTGTSAYEEGEKTEQSLIWNLAFILDNLFGQLPNAEEFTQILETTNQMLEKQLENDRNNLDLIKRLLSN